MRAAKQIIKWKGIKMNRKRAACQLIHDLRSQLLASKQSSARIETETAIITLAKGTFHLHIYAGTIEEGYKIYTLKNHWATDEHNIGNIVSCYI
jgi:hypothetical protein